MMLDQARRQALGWFVDQDQVGIAHQGAAHRQHLLFAARQHASRVILPLLQIRKQRKQQVGVLLEEIANRGISILLVEQKLTIALAISHRVYVMGHGRIVFEALPTNCGITKQ